MKALRKIVWLAAGLLFCILALGGCDQSRGKNQTGKEVAFSTVDPDEAPEELKEIIEKNKQGEIKMSYLDGDVCYAVRGYGRQKTGGYSIQVNGVWEREDGIHVDTSLMGPGKDQEIAKEPSYPFLILKLKQTEADLLFD